MTSKLSGKVALVTGGSAGIGLGIAKRFAEEGARVFITGRRQSELDKAVTAIGGGATAWYWSPRKLSSDLRRATVHKQLDAGDVGTLVGSEEHCGLTEIVGCPDPA